jgi:two-component system, sensor histidine kinase PdtaS
MSNLSRLMEICLKHTNLTERHVGKIEEVAAQLQKMADLAQSNVFIDCLTDKENTAIVVAEACPQSGTSLYSQSVVGCFAYESYEPGVLRTLRTGLSTIRNRAITQEGKSVKQSVVPIHGEDGFVIAALIMEQDISAQIKRDKQLNILNQTTKELSHLLIGMTEEESFLSDMIQESLYVTDIEGRILYANAHGINFILEMGGSEDIIGFPIQERLAFLVDMNGFGHGTLFQEITVGNKVLEVKSVWVRNISSRAVLDSMPPFSPTIGSILVIRDITELREKERQLMVKSTVIKEIHHRVKNNLQTVASLLRLQMRRGVPEEAKKLFEESLNRISSIASVHEILSNTGLDQVEMRVLVEKIGKMLVLNSSVDETKIEIKFRGESFRLKSDKAVSFALILNELILNSMEHAFIGKRSGKIRVEVFVEYGTAQVLVLDDGVGYSGPQGRPTLGLQIVQTLTEHDLFGAFTIERTHEGTKATVSFPLEEVAG